MTAGDDADETRKLRANESAKLFATYLNVLAIGVFIVGAVAPIFTYIFASEAARPPFALVVLGSVICQAVSGGLHLLARRPLRGLRP
jgi:hypothetical protein